MTDDWRRSDQHDDQSLYIVHVHTHNHTHTYVHTHPSNGTGSTIKESPPVNVYYITHNTTAVPCKTSKTMRMADNAINRTEIIRCDTAVLELKHHWCGLDNITGCWRTKRVYPRCYCSKRQATEVGKIESLRGRL